MLVVCSWCERIIGYKSGDGTSHGICYDCFEKQKEEIQKFYENINVDEFNKFLEYWESIKCQY